MDKFKRRTYQGIREMLADLIWPLRHRAQLRQAIRSGLVSAQFRERLMMVVTAVNQCRYCAAFHTKESLRVGLATHEIRGMLAGDLATAPEDELPALLYAQHYAETNGRPDTITRQSLQTTYGRSRAEAIETVLRLIRMGNLLGNSADWVLYKVSYGRWGS
ncbi:carboxymuconolactone decarboxylase family protein [Candidatus Leptofilum sp.]|uniref:carboxymuconolactone decarboxylase family protein n=1 Tax=Candidatus Leptofilum sp. TaxID=3241576 RepID=UPI003B5A9AED